MLDYDNPSRLVFTESAKVYFVAMSKAGRCCAIACITSKGLLPSFKTRSHNQFPDPWGPQTRRAPSWNKKKVFFMSLDVMFYRPLRSTSTKVLLIEKKLCLVFTIFEICLVLVLLAAHVKQFIVSRMRDFSQLSWLCGHIVSRNAEDLKPQSLYLIKSICDKSTKNQI